MVRTLLPLLVAFVVALAIAPIFGNQYLKVAARCRQWWKQSKIKWSLALGRYFIRQYKKLSLTAPATEIASAADMIAPSNDEKPANQGGDQDEAYTTPLLGKLTPVADAQNIGLYEVELASKLDDPDVKNIAITGPYGSGKSSIIKTFFHRYPQYQPLYVSLAAFKDERKTNGKPNNEDDGDGGDGGDKPLRPPRKMQPADEAATTPEQQKVLDDRIEYSILQQLFYHVRGKDVPFSRLKRIRTVHPSKILRFSVLVFLYAIFVLYLYVPSWLPGYELWADYVTDKNWLSYLAMAATVGGGIYLVYLLFRFQQHASMIKLNLDKAQLEIAPDRGSSVLNQHMDEIVYYFGATRHDLLVIEDLDRFKNPEIFVKLREINTLINNSLQINRKVTFIYALRDDVFVDESRTKFFDFILPVVPVTNASNAASKLINMFSGIAQPNSISREFLNDLSLFLTDRRLIQNIYNEYRVYQYQLRNDKLNPDKLLAMIVYKNNHPTDFSDLQANRGMVYDLFEQKKTLNAELAQKKRDRVIQLQQRIEMVESNHLRTLEELRMVYVMAVFNDLARAHGDETIYKIYLETAWASALELQQEQTFDTMRRKNKLTIYFRHSSSLHSRTFSEIEHEVDSTQTYEQRKAALTEIYNLNVINLSTEIQNIRNEANFISGQPLSELLTHRKLDTIPTEINRSKLLAYLINNGHINEEYWLYLSYFEPGQLTQEDLRFIMAVKSREMLPAEHPLSRIERILERLNDADCLLASTLNHDLVKWLTTHQKHHPVKFESIVRQFSQVKEEHLAFLEGFRATYSKLCKQLVAAIIGVNIKFWRTIKKAAPLQVPFYLDAIVTQGAINDIVNCDHDRQLSKSIANTNQFFSDVYYHDNTQLVDVTKALRIEYTVAPSSDTPRINKDFIVYIYENHHYAINAEMIVYMLRSFMDLEQEPASKRSQANFIFVAEQNAPLRIHLQKNLSTYLKQVFLQLPDGDPLSEDVMALFLTVPTVVHETKIAIIEKVTFQIDDLAKVPPLHYDALFVQNRVKPSWYNIQLYKNHQQSDTISKDTTDWLLRDQVIANLSNDSIESYPEADQANYRKILVDILQNGAVRTADKLSLFRINTFRLTFTDATTIEQEVIQETLERDLVDPNETSINTLFRDKFPWFIEVLNMHWETLLPLLPSQTWTTSKLKTLLDDSRFIDEQKDHLYDLMSKEQYLELLKTETVIPLHIIYSPRFLLSQSELLQIADKVKVPIMVVGLIQAHPSIEKETILLMLKQFGGPFKKIAQQEGEYFRKSEVLLNLLTALCERRILISSFDEKDKEVAVTFLREE